MFTLFWSFLIFMTVDPHFFVQIYNIFVIISLNILSTPFSFSVLYKNSIMYILSNLVVSNSFL
jgi:hypothetical protein